GRMNDETVAVGGFFTISLREIAANKLGVVGRPRSRKVFCLVDADGLGVGCRRIRLGNMSIVDHAVEYIPLTALCPIWISERIVPTRGLRKPGDERCLGKREILHVFSKVRARRGLDAVRAMP